MITFALFSFSVFAMNIPQAPKSKADILWVVDNSASMWEYQHSLYYNTNDFMTDISTTKKIDWRMGIISTDTRDPLYIGFGANNLFNHADSDPVGRFKGFLAKIGTQGNHTEQAFIPIRQTFDRFPHFLRPDSHLVIIIVSDEPEDGRESVQEFVNYLHTLRPPELISTYGIFAMQEKNCGDQVFRGSRYDEFINFTNGLAFPICSPDYGQDLITALKASF